MKPYDYAEELGRLSAEAPMTDSLYRLAGRSVYEFDKPLIQDHRDIYYEQHYAPAGAQSHAAIEPYLAMFAEADDEIFRRQALGCSIWIL